MLEATQRKWLGHGVLMMMTTLLGGVGLWMHLVGGFEIIPGYILHFQLPGTADGWVRAHTGPVLNGLMVIGVALVLPRLDFTEAVRLRPTLVAIAHHRLAGEPQA